MKLQHRNHIALLLLIAALPCIGRYAGLAVSQYSQELLILLSGVVCNTTACIVLDTQHLCPTQQLLCHLHWLPVHFCINYKIVTLTYKILAYNQPLYLSHLLTPYTPVCALRLQDKCLLCPHFPQT